MSVSAHLTHFLPLALAVGLVIGALACGMLAIVLRTTYLAQHAHERYVLVLTALVTMALSVPAFDVSATLVSQRVPTVLLASVPERGSVHSLHPVPSTLVRIETRHDRLRAVDAGSSDLPAPVAEHVDLAQACLLVWLVGFAIALVRLAGGILRLRAIKRRARYLETRVTARGPIAILESDAFPVPVALGYRHPAVLLPTSLTARADHHNVEHVVLHEIEHVLRYDDVSLVIQVACVAILWFNPFAHHLAQRLVREREMACDESVIRRTGQRVAYAKTLWALATFGSVARLPRLLSAFAAGRHTVARVENILRAVPPTRRGLPVMWFASVVVAVLVGSSVAVSAVVVRAPAIRDAAIVRLRDGDTLAIGGRTADGFAVASAQLYSPDGRRRAVIPMVRGAWAASATELSNGDVLVLGGMTDRGTTATAQRYALKTHRFLALPPMRVARAGHTATALLDGRVLVAAGEHAPGRYTAATELYDPRTGRSVLTMDGTGRVFATALLIDRGSVVMFGGRDGTSTNVPCAIIFDPERNGYRDAGTVVARSARTISFKLGGSIVTHYIRDA